MWGVTRGYCIGTTGKLNARATCLPLREDPDLAEAIAPRLRAAAIERCVALCAWIPTGPWNSHGDFAADGIGLLLLDGLMIRRVGVQRDFGAELLGAGDLLRPWEDDELMGPLFQTTGWRTLQPTRVAILDRGAAERMAVYPELVGALVGRALSRARNLAVNMAIVHQPRVDARLHMLLWQLAGRWGRVRSDGVVMPLKLTHAVLADLVAARRPTVTSALSELVAQELLSPLSAGWLLCGSPPAELVELGGAEKFSADGWRPAPAHTVAASGAARE